MEINWEVRVKNPLWWAQVTASIVMPLIIGMGYEWEDMTSWSTLFSVILSALGNPVVVVTMVTSLFAAITDPTTKGLKDSGRAMRYKKPYSVKDEVE